LIEQDHEDVFISFNVVYTLLGVSLWIDESPLVLPRFAEEEKRISIIQRCIISLEHGRGRQQ